MTEAEQHERVWAAISKTGRFSPEDLQSLREGLRSVPTFTQPGHVMILSRLSVEIIDALIALNSSVHKLDQTSTDLITTTNKLTQRIFWLTVVAVIIGLLAFV